MRTSASSLIFLTMVAVGAPTALAQSEPRAAVSASVGVGSGSSDTGVAVDLALNIGGGLRFNVSERLMVRPDARALVVLADGEPHTLGVFVVHVAYRF